MSKLELLKLIALLSMEERRELREILDEAPRRLTEAPRRLTPEELADNPMLKVLEEIDKLPPMNVPPDFGVNHDYYLHGGEKREP